MGRALARRGDFTAADLKRLARASRDADQTRRLLALAVIYDGGSRAEAAETGGVGHQIVALLVAAHEHGLDAIEAACRTALDEGLRSADAVLNILSRRREESVAASIVAPAHLQLREEPIADCARYDRLIAEARHGAA